MVANIKQIKRKIFIMKQLAKNNVIDLFEITEDESNEKLITFQHKIRKDFILYLFDDGIVSINYFGDFIEDVDDELIEAILGIYELKTTEKEYINKLKKILKRYDKICISTGILIREHFCGFNINRDDDYSFETELVDNVCVKISYIYEEDYEIKITLYPLFEWTSKRPRFYEETMITYYVPIYDIKRIKYIIDNRENLLFNAQLENETMKFIYIKEHIGYDNLEHESGYYSLKYHYLWRIKKSEIEDFITITEKEAKEHLRDEIYSVIKYIKVDTDYVFEDFYGVSKEKMVEIIEQQIKDWNIKDKKILKFIKEYKNNLTEV